MKKPRLAEMAEDGERLMFQTLPQFYNSQE